MNKSKLLKLSLIVTVLSLSSVASAYTLNTDYFKAGELEVKYDNTTGGINLNSGALNVDTNINQISEAGVSGKATVPGLGTQSVSVSTSELQKLLPAGTSLDISSSALNIKTANGTVGVELRKTLQGGLNVNVDSLSPEARRAIVNLPGGVENVIKSRADVQAYGELVSQMRPGIRDVVVDENGEIRVKYQQPARLFGFIPRFLNADVVVSADGKVDIKLPWYSFLYRKNAGELEAMINAELAKSDSGTKATVSGEAGNAQSDAKVINIVSSTVAPAASTSASSGASAGTNTSGSGSAGTGSSGSAPVCNAPSEFPFGNYAAKVEVTNSADLSIGKSVQVSGNGSVKTAIAQSLELSDNAKVTTAYVFNMSQTIPPTNIATLYVSVDTGLQNLGTIGGVVKLSKKDLVRKAMYAAGLLGAECNY